MSISHFSCKVGGLKIKEFLLVGKRCLRAVLVKFWAWSPILKLLYKNGSANYSLETNPYCFFNW